MEDSKRWEVFPSGSETMSQFDDQVDTIYYAAGLYPDIKVFTLKSYNANGVFIAEYAFEIENIDENSKISFTLKRK